MTAPDLVAVAAAAVLVWMVVSLWHRLPPMRRLVRNVRIVPEGALLGRDDVVEWGALEEVRVETTADGPWEPDLFLVLVSGGGRTVRIPFDVLPGDLHGRLEQLPGFDYAPFIQALGCTEKAAFVCWRKESGTGAVVGGADLQRVTCRFRHTPRRTAR